MSWWMRTIARGYRPAPWPPATPRFLVGEGLCWSASDADSASLPDAAGGIVVFCPTYLERASCERHVLVVEHLGEQLEAVRARFQNLPVALIVGLQHGDSPASAGVQRLEALAAAARRASSAPFVGFVLAGSGKTRSLGVGIELAERLRARALVLIDDDVRLEPGCIAALIARFLDKGSRGAVGATKLALGGAHWSARWLARVGRHVQPARATPHACCMIVALEVVAGGIPARYVDDAYVFFELLDPASSDPLEWLEVIPEARCWHVVGSGSLRSTLRGLRRVLLTHHVCLADYPAKASFYRRELLFYGFWPFGTRAVGLGVRRAAAKWLAKLLYFGLFSTVGAELLLRGLCGRPLTDLGWSSSTLARPGRLEAAC